MNFRLLKPLQREEGNIIIIAAVSVIIFMLMVAVVVDVGILLFRRVQLQNAADSAALAAAGYWGEEYKGVYEVEFSSVPDEEEALAAAHLKAHITARQRAGEAEVKENLRTEAEKYLNENYSAAFIGEGEEYLLIDEIALKEDEEDEWSKWVSGGQLFILAGAEESLIFGSLAGFDSWTFTMKAGAEWWWRWKYVDDPNNPGHKNVEGETRVNLND